MGLRMVTRLYWNVGGSVVMSLCELKIVIENVTKVEG